MQTELIILFIILLPVLLFEWYFVGKKTAHDSAKSKRIEEYPFYTFITPVLSAGTPKQPTINQYLQAITIFFVVL